MQTRFNPDSADSLQLSFDGPLSAFQFAGNFGVLSPLKLEQHDSLHRVVRKRIEQLRTTFGYFSQFIGWRLVASNGVDTGSTKVNKSRLTTYGSASAFLTMNMPLLRRDFPRRDNGQQTPQSVAIPGFKSAIGQTVTQTVKRTVCRILFVIVPTGLHVEFLCREILQSHGNVLPQLLGGLLIPVGKLVNPARNCFTCHPIESINV
jgi:hypothetical protein